MKRRITSDTQRRRDEASATVAEAILRVIPERQSEYDELREMYGDDQPGLYLIFGHVFVPYLLTLLDNVGSDDKLRRLFALVEDLVTQPDEYVQEATAIEICERLVNVSSRREKAFLYAGPQTRQKTLAMEAW